MRDYVLENRGNEYIDDVLNILYSRHSPDSEPVWFHASKNKKEEQEQFELLKRIIEEKTTKKDTHN